jgi:hypothetical protein
VGSFAFKISISCRIFQFLRLGVVSMPCEWSWAIKLSAATVVAPYWEPKAALTQMLFWRFNIEDGSSPSPGLFAAPYIENTGRHTTIRSSSKTLAPFFLTGSSVILNINNKKNILLMSPVLGQI